MAVLVVVCTVAVGLLELRQYRREVWEDARGDLLAVADMKATEVARWREERLSVGRSIATNHLVARIAARAQRGSAPDLVELASWCAELSSQHDEYVAAVVFGARGQRLAASGRESEAVPPAEHLERVQREAKVSISELHLGERGALHADVIAPLSLSESDGAFVGHVVLRIDPGWHLVPSVEVWPGLGSTGEAMLFQRSADGHLVVATRAGGITTLARGGSAYPLAAAVASGASGIVETVDVRGHRVLAAVRAVAGSDLSVVAKLDAHEIAAPVHQRALWLLAVGISLAVAVLSATRLWWRAQVEVFRCRQTEADLRRLALEQHFGYLTRHSSDILLLFDERHRVVEANDRAAEAYGYPREDLLGIHARELLAPKARPELAQRLAAIAAGQNARFETRHSRRDGTTFPVEVSARAIEVEGEHYLQAIIRDITAGKRTELALRMTEERLQLAVDATGVGVWDWSRRGGGLYYSANLLATLGYAPGEIRGLAALRRLLHPDDRVAVGMRLEGATDAAVETEVRVRAQDGVWKRFRCRIRLLRHEVDGRPARVVGTAMLATREST